MDSWLAKRASALDDVSTARADELAIGDVLEAVDVRWWSHSPVRVVEPTEDGKLTLAFTSENDRDRTLTVPANRRFLKAAKA